MTRTNWSTQIKKGYLDLCVLALIKANQRLYGLQLISLLQENDVPVKEGTLYPLLARMTKDLLLKATWETHALKGHPRKFYALTKAGEHHLEGMQEEFEAMVKIYKKIKKNGGNHGK